MESTYGILSVRSHTALSSCYLSSQRSGHIFMKFPVFSQTLPRPAVACWDLQSDSSMLHTYLGCEGNISLLRPSPSLVIFSEPGLTVISLSPASFTHLCATPSLRELPIHPFWGHRVHPSTAVSTESSLTSLWSLPSSTTLGKITFLQPRLSQAYDRSGNIFWISCCLPKQQGLSVYIMITSADPDEPALGYIWHFRREEVRVHRDCVYFLQCQAESLQQTRSEDHMHSSRRVTDLNFHRILTCDIKTWTKVTDLTLLAILPPSLCILWMNPSAAPGYQDF